MKKVIYLIIPIVLFYSCKNADNNNSGTMNNASDSSMHEKNVALVQAVYKAINEGNKASLDTLISNDMVEHQMINGHEINSGDSVRAMLVDLHNHFQDLKFEEKEVASNGDYIFSMYQQTSIGKDPAYGAPAGTKMDMKGVDVMRAKDGKIVEHWGFMDANEMMKMMRNSSSPDQKIKSK